MEFRTVFDFSLKFIDKDKLCNIDFIFYTLQEADGKASLVLNYRVALYMKNQFKSEILSNIFFSMGHLSPYEEQQQFELMFIAMKEQENLMIL